MYLAIYLLIKFQIITFLIEVLKSLRILWILEWLVKHPKSIEILKLIMFAYCGRVSIKNYIISQYFIITNFIISYFNQYKNLIPIILYSISRIIL